jgi:hypothetical protein
MPTFSSFANIAGDSEGELPIIGTMLMLSVPAATITSASPTRMRSAAIWIALRPEAQKRFTVMPPTLCGRPASTAPMRATFRPCGPSGIAQPHTRSSMAVGSSVGTWASAPCSARTSRSSGRMWRKKPRCERPMGVRVAATM